MFGIIAIASPPVLICVLLIAAYNSKIQAKKTCRDIEIRLAHDDSFRKIIFKFVENNLFEYNSNVIDSKEIISLISKTDLGIEIKSSNGQNSLPFPKSKFNKLIIKLQQKQVIYSYSPGSFSIYYNYPSPYENTILRISCPQKILFSFER